MANCSKRSLAARRRVMSWTMSPPSCADSCLQHGPMVHNNEAAFPEGTGAKLVQQIPASRKEREKWGTPILNPAKLNAALRICGSFAFYSRDESRTKNANPCGQLNGAPHGFFSDTKINLNCGTFSSLLGGEFVAVRVVGSGNQTPAEIRHIRRANTFVIGRVVRVRISATAVY